MRQFRKIYRAFVDKTYQRQIAYDYIKREIESYLQVGRISSDMAGEFFDIIRREDMYSYICGFGAHLLIDLIKLSGILTFAVFLLALATHSYIPLLYVVLFPLLRTSYTACQICRNRGRPSYKVAFWVGMLPGIGRIAFPAQIYSAYPEFAKFILRGIWDRIRNRHPEPQITQNRDK